MNRSSLAALFTIVFINTVASTSAKITIINNGYENILIALPPTVTAESRPKLVANLKSLLHQSSLVLLKATKDRASFQSVTFLVPSTWGNIDTWLSKSNEDTTLEEAGALINRDLADIVVTNPNEREYPYTLHHRGCGKQSLRIYLPYNYSMTGNLQRRSVELVRLWSEFRYGVFPEGGFEEDDQYPLTFRLPGEKHNRTTDCVNRPFRVPHECEVEWKCDRNFVKPSILDQHYTNGTYFCEGHTGLGQIHSPDAPTKHNLLCSEEGAYLTVLRSPDFKNGRNAAPRFQSQKNLEFRYIREATTARVFVAIDISSQMRRKDRYALTKNAFSRFVIHDLPNGSNLSLLIFGGKENDSLITSDFLIEDKNSRISYLESQPLPEETSEEANSCPECTLDNIITLFKNDSGPAPHVIIVTTQLYVNEFMYKDLVTSLQELEIHLHVLLFHTAYSSDVNQKSSWYNLCKETNNQFISLEGDLLGNLYNAFASSVQALSRKVLVAQKYLTTLDEENIFFPISVDASLSQSLTVSVSGPSFGRSPLKYDSTILTDPRGSTLYPQKQELLPAWIFHDNNPQVGVYTLKTWRKRREINPILVTVTGQPSENEDSITVKVWVETVESGFSQPPIQIFGEVRKGDYPVKNATVTAYVHHPNNDGVSQVILLDDGLGSVDITKNDGIYSRFFTNFTSKGFYNVRLTVTVGIDDIATVQIGPSSPCCGSIFPSNEQTVTDQFQREAGPITFEVTTVPEYDSFPPARVTDLRIARTYDLMFVLQWTAVGNDYDAGVASTYEVKLFRDRSLIRNRFFDSSLEVYNETIETTDDATYGTTLFHVLKFSQPLDSGLYYAAIRAMDDSGNSGEPSNSVAIYLESKTTNKHIDCGNSPVALGLNSAVRISTPTTFLYVSIFWILSFFSWRLTGKCTFVS